MPHLGTVHMAATPANIRSPKTSYSPSQCGRSCCGTGEKEKVVSNQKLSMKQKLSFLGSVIVIASSPVKVKKQKTNEKHNDGRSILVQAFTRQGKEFHIAEAEITLDSDGAFAVDYVAAKLLLKGTLYVSDTLFGRQ